MAGSLSRWFLVCLVLSLCASSAKGSDAGTLEANGVSYELNNAQYVHKFYDGEVTVFTCRTTRLSGIHIALFFSGDSNENLKLQATNSVSRTATLTTANNNTVVHCSIFGIQDKTSSADLKLVLNNKKRVNIWIIVFSVVVGIILVAVGLWIWITYKNRRKQSSSNMVTYADRNSIENLDPRAKQQNGDAGVDGGARRTNGPTSTSDTNSHPHRVSVQGDPTDVSVQGDPTDVSVQDVQNDRSNVKRESAPAPGYGLCALK